MPSCLALRYRLQDLVFSLWGTLAFLGDLGIDVWSAVKYYQGGDTALAILHFGLYAFSSSVLQLLSWGWFWVDWREWAPEVAAAGDRSTANGHTELNGIRNAEAGGCSVDAAVCVDEESKACHRAAEPLLQANGDTGLPERHTAAIQDVMAPPTPEPGPAEEEESPSFISHFYTSRIWLWPSCLPLLHILHLGYPLRCLHSLEVGIAAYRSSESSPKFSLYQEYAYFLTHDISMMRLVETFLENTPQLIFLLYNIIQRETIHLFQYFGIAISFICISWAILDYHQSLRLFLKDKEKLNILSSIIYFLWNFCLISSRIMCITLFTVTFHWMIALHFIGVWFVFFLWTWLQKTNFMKSNLLEPFYRATVAGILYFSWFNIADGRTFYRCIIYHIFITTDSMLLLCSWKFLSFPSCLDKYESFIIWAAVLLTGLGLVVRLVYYKFVHPNVIREAKSNYDEPDSSITFKMFAPTVKKKFWKQNNRMVHLTQQIY
ncbi:XK-related protein 8 [Mantella aurantiaca]